MKCVWAIDVNEGPEMWRTCTNEVNRERDFCRFHADMADADDYRGIPDPNEVQ